ncbi:MAG: hypothetical protein EOO11_01950 [Chitinophagaceae bacterium]|nr:MAG: hypothetical protein EOO11_01950 [Chitinophagaceae bacterium]
MHILAELAQSLQANGSRNALCIDKRFYTYHELAVAVSGIRQKLSGAPDAGSVVGIVANDDLPTYAAIIAIWLEGKTYVPLNPDTPVDRNRSILGQAGIRVLLDSSETPVLAGEVQHIGTRELPAGSIDLSVPELSSDSFAYILFTSGSTGLPKGVPITHANLSGFVRAFDAIGLEIGADDRCLQMFELTFDLSVMSYLVPFLKGACVYTIPKRAIKFSYIFELIDEEKLTVALMVPSILHYLRPYFDEIDAPWMRYSLFCGEALPLDLAEEWSQCLPAARVLNVYGPTEDTIFCTTYELQRGGGSKHHQGIMSIGTAMLGTITRIVDEAGNEVAAGQEGELCLGGVQLTPGYLNNEAKNKETFFMAADGTRLYRTGDLCYADAEGDIFYIGRLDFQVKIQGFRVELAEIEFHAKAFLGKYNVIALAFDHESGNMELGLVVEAKEQDTDGLRAHLKSQLPAYMIPSQIHFEETFPLNVNGKFDRKELKKKFLQYG